jgi:hypothetical protein
MNSCNFWIPSLVKAALLGELDHDEVEEGDHAAGAPASPAAAAPMSSTALIVKSSLLSALPFCAAAVAMVANAYHAKRADERRLHTVFPMLVAALSLLLLPWLADEGTAWALLALTFAAGGIWATHGPFFR